MKENKTIAIDFDGVIHKYSEGWQDGEIYDKLMEGSIDSINKLIIDGWDVFIFSARSPNQIVKWFNKKHRHRDCIFGDRQDWGYTPNFKLKKIPFWIKFWKNKKDGSVPVIGVTNKKLPAKVYLDDKAMLFKSWKDTMHRLQVV